MAGSFNFGEWISARSVIGATLNEIGAENDKLYVCTPDVAMSLIEFKENYPERFIDVGIAEQNCIGVAAGIALEGNIPVVMGMLPFLSMRACEQVRTDVCYQNLPVRIIGTGGGLTSGGGSTHNAMEDIAILKSMVNMTVLSIGDPNMIRDILKLSMDYEGQCISVWHRERKTVSCMNQELSILKLVEALQHAMVRILQLSVMVKWSVWHWMPQRSWLKRELTCG